MGVEWLAPLNQIHLRVSPHFKTDSPDDLCLFEPASSSKRLTGRVPFVHGFSLPIDPFGSCAPVDQRNIHHSGISLVHLVSAVPANKVNPAGEDEPTVVC